MNYVVKKKKKLVKKIVEIFQNHNQEQQLQLRILTHQHQIIHQIKLQQRKKLQRKKQLQLKRPQQNLVIGVK